MIHHVLSRLRSLVSGLSSPIGFLFDGPTAAPEAPAGAPASGSPSAPAGGGTPASPTSSTGRSTLPAGTPSAPTGAAPTGFRSFATEAEYNAEAERLRNEGRRGWVPSHRLAEETTRRTELEQTYQNRIRALAGLETVTPEQQEAQRVREGFFQMFPEFGFLRTLSPEKLQAFERALENGSNADEVVRHHWDTHAQRTFDDLASRIESSLSLERLTDRQFNGMVTQFKSFAQTKIQSDPQFQRRYESGDPALLDEFVKEFTEDWVAPSRRAALVPIVSRPRVPSGGRTPQVTTPPPNLTNINSPEEAENAGIQYMRDRGAMA